ncbi:peptidase M26 [Prevotella nigrescens]|uniref:peptidase M26 n=1 Tax=Prevotella nigrescens TaxID=28133 RepID=UPI0028E32AF0|nr:peptidase M26 [Prevotella nigrescens]
MKTKNLIERLSLFLLALVLTMPTWAQKERGGGSTFSIGSAADWKTFCNRVNGGETTLNAKLTANIELNADIDLGQEIVMVGNQYHLYSGTFDGQGHTLTINWNTGTSVRVSPFQRVKNTTIKNLHVKGEIKSKADGLTGLINDVYGTTTISGCIIEVNLKAKTILAGMVRWVNIDAKLTITDCIVKGDFTVTKKGGKISGFVCRQYGNCTLTNCLYLGTNNANNNENYTFAGDNTEVKNCYYLNPCGNAQGTPITKEQLRSGEVAHLLQNGRGKTVWGQVLGTDTIPQLTAEAAKHVYEVKFTLNNEVKATRYANKDGKVILPTTKDIVGEGYNPHHYYALAFGDGFSASTTITEDRQVAVTLDHKEYYEIKNKDDWKAFCDIVESGQTSVDAKLTKDVDLGEEIVMAGTADPSYYNFFYYTGTFDGQGHTLKFNWNAGKDDRIAPFKYVKDATIKNLRTQGKITKKGYGLSGMVYIALGTTTISGCISDVDITGGSDLGGSHAAGMVEAVADGASVHITDCLVKGSITDNADESYKAMAGFVMSNSGTYTLTRCLYVGKNNATNDKYSETFGETGGYGATFTDCYYLNTCGKAQGDKITEEQLKNGYVAYKLQKGIESQVWGQTLGTDTIPQPTTDAKKRVYEVKFTYNGEVKATRYATNGQSIHGGLPTAQDLLGTGYNPHHYYAIAFADGFNASTTVTADRQVTVSITEKDHYEIKSVADWKNFCGLVNNGGQNGMNVKMTADVNIGSDIAKAGTSSTPYRGTFDGQNHTLTLNWTDNENSDIAPFRRVSDATIKNLRTEGSITARYYYLSGLIDEAAGGNIIVSNCVSNVNITSTHNDPCRAAGLVNYVFTNAHATINDCIVKGSINATTDKGQLGMGGFVYVQNGTLVMNNCLYAGNNNAYSDGEKNNTFAPTNTSGGTTLNNCYYLNACGEVQGEQITSEQLKNGEVAKMLQAGRTDRCYWAQTLGELIDLYREADKGKTNYVYHDGSKWVCDDFRLTDGTPLPIGLDFLAARATYERPFSSKNNATLCLPYELPCDGSFTVYNLSGGSKTSISFKETKDKLEAYRPYYITTDGTPQLGGNNLQVKAYKDDGLKQPAGAFRLVGTVTGVDNATAAADNAYSLQPDGKFHKVTTDNPGATVPAYRAYITCPKTLGAKEFSVILEGETTGIGGVTNEATDGKNGPVYDLQGRRVADRLDDARHRLPAGVYIVGGRKVIVK